MGASTLLSPETLAQGCAMCGTVVGSAKDPLARGIFLSILLMISVPNILIASFGGWLFYVYRKDSLRRRLEAVPGSPQEQDLNRAGAESMPGSPPRSGSGADQPGPLGERT